MVQLDTTLFGTQTIPSVLSNSPLYEILSDACQVGAVWKENLLLAEVRIYRQSLR